MALSAASAWPWPFPLPWERWPVSTWTNISARSPWLFFIFLGFGIVAAFRNLYILYNKQKTCDARKKLQDIKTFNWVILFILGALSGVFMEVQFTLGVILGGLIIIANFSLLHHTMRNAFSDQSSMKGNRMALIAKFYFRLAIMGLIIYILITELG